MNHPNAHLSSLTELKQRFFDAMRMRNRSPVTLGQWNYSLRRLLDWLFERGIHSADEITPEVL